MALSAWAIAAIVVASLIVASFVYTKLTAPGFHVAGKHMFITGGNQGIGLAVAKKYAAAGARVTIAARNLTTLEAARVEIERASPSGQRVCVQQCDVTDTAAVQRAVDAATAFHGTIDHLICCAGWSIPGRFAEQDLSVHQRIMDINYFGELRTIQAALPTMSEPPASRRRRDRRRIVLVSSGLGLISWTGYASYSPTKYAIRGLAEALRNEFLLYDIDVSIFYPGSVETPGNTEQDNMRPKECEQIQGSETPATPESAAQALINGLSDGQFAITNELIISALRTIANGINPRGNTPLELLFLPFIVLFQLCYGFYVDRIVLRARDARRKQRSAPNARTSLVDDAPRKLS